MKSTVLGIVIVLSLLAAGAIFYASPLQRNDAQPVVQSYANDALGITFTYPLGYVLNEKAIGTPLQAHYAITLVRQEDTAVSVNGEGPTTITLDFYQNNANNETLNNWLATDQSNFKLGDGTLASTSVDGTEAVRYMWSGLYQGESTAFLHNGNAVVVSVTYNAPSDTIRSDYEAVLSSLKLH